MHPFSFFVSPLSQRLIEGGFICEGTYLYRLWCCYYYTVYF